MSLRATNQYSRITCSNLSAKITGRYQLPVIIQFYLITIISGGDMKPCGSVNYRLTGMKTGLRKYEIKKSNQKVIVDPAVKDIRPYTACAIIKNLRLNSEKIKEIMQIQEKLHITIGRNRKNQS